MSASTKPIPNPFSAVITGGISPPSQTAPPPLSRDDDQYDGTYGTYLEQRIHFVVTLEIRKVEEKWFYELSRMLCIWIKIGTDDLLRDVMDCILGRINPETD